MVDVKIGLEIHGYLKMSDTKKKLFCNCDIKDTDYNLNTCPVCTGQPGTKTMLPNKEAIKKIITCALMMNCKVNKRLLFQRKHYSWPDLPNGYQKTISGAYSHPVGVNGNFLDIGIEECHLEEDPARWDPITGKVDYNRSGFPLIEIVTKPDFKDSEQVRTWMKKLFTSLGYIDALDPDAGFKSDVNVSIEPKFLRTEIKNVNSLTGIKEAIEYEISRLKEEPNESMQTRTWDDISKTTKFMRKKESATEYMFIPEPDLPIINIQQADIDAIEITLPEKPEEKIKKFIKMGAKEEDAKILAQEIKLAVMFEKVAKIIQPELAGKWLRRELLRVLNYNDKTIDEIALDERHMIELLELVRDKIITDTTAQRILNLLVEKEFSPKEYVKKEGLGAISGEDDLMILCQEAVKENPGAVDDYKKGEEKSFNFLVGQVMRKTKGKASPDVVNKLLKGILK